MVVQAGHGIWHMQLGWVVFDKGRTWKGRRFLSAILIMILRSILGMYLSLVVSFKAILLLFHNALNRLINGCFPTNNIES